MTTTTLPLYDDHLKALIRATTGDEPCHARPDMWFSGDNAAASIRNQRTAKTLCRSCHIRNLCADYALTHDVHGIWAGLDEHDRQQHRQDAA